MNILEKPLDQQCIVIADSKYYNRMLNSRAWAKESCRKSWEVD
jgi:hypothetical protein